MTTDRRREKSAFITRATSGINGQSGAAVRAPASEIRQALIGQAA